MSFVQTHTANTWTKINHNTSRCSIALSLSSFWYNHSFSVKSFCFLSCLWIRIKFTGLTYEELKVSNTQLSSIQFDISMLYVTWCSKHRTKIVFNFNLMILFSTDWNKKYILVNYHLECILFSLLQCILVLRFLPILLFLTKIKQKKNKI